MLGDYQNILTADLQKVEFKANCLSRHLICLARKAKRVGVGINNLSRR